ncbi:hypothetical protein PVAP13_7NG210100 [Panicum virgatum]|uniref:Uncharacterized protein n=1 Tax=Panicum virgatum TaxID=38727 RepID=A0A8T0PZ08_PANVG|nr:hypothetical protein PVAP13_7NG210100 [Panicum virgatum]
MLGRDGSTHGGEESDYMCAYMELQWLLREHTQRARCHSRASRGSEVVEAAEQGAVKPPAQGPREAANAGTRGGHQRWGDANAGGG